MILFSRTAAASALIVGWATSTLLSTTMALQTLAPSPSPSMSGICITDTPDATCGTFLYEESCANLVQNYHWSGTCCSLTDVTGGGCLLQVDGPGSSCTWSNVHDSMTVIIGTNNNGTCPASDYDVLEAPVPSQYKICLSASFADCANDCTQYTNNFAKTFQQCHKQRPNIATSCLNDAALQCHDAKGIPPAVVCQNLTPLRRTGKLRSGACQKLKRKCGTAASSAQCYNY